MFKPWQKKIIPLHKKKKKHIQRHCVSNPTYTHSVLLRTENDDVLLRSWKAEENVQRMENEEEEEKCEMRKRRKHKNSTQFLVCFFVLKH